MSNLLKIKKISAIVLTLFALLISLPLKAEDEEKMYLSCDGIKDYANGDEIPTTKTFILQKQIFSGVLRYTLRTQEISFINDCIEDPLEIACGKTIPGVINYKFYLDRVNGSVLEVVKNLKDYSENPIIISYMFKGKCEIKDKGFL